MNGLAPTLHLCIAELIITREPAIISTVLGSCVSVCIFSTKMKIGGMIHYALPQAPNGVSDHEAYRYGNLAIPALIEELTQMSGLQPWDFCAKVVGGAAEIGGGPSAYPIGAENVEIAFAYLRQYKIPIVGQSVGTESGRKVLFHVPSGRLQVAKIPKTEVFDQPMLVKAEPPQRQQPRNVVSMAASDRRRRVLIVDDSKTIRDLLARILKEDSSLEVVGQAADAYEAAAMLTSLRPDVITLDIQMPKMTGVEWLEQLLPSRPIPVVMISSLQMKEGNEVFKALELGAVDYIQKPTLAELPVVGPLIREKVKSASFARVHKKKLMAARPVSSGQMDLRKILVIGASTGGTEAIKSVLCALPETIPATLIVQHIPPVFSKAFSDRLNDLCPFEVKEAEDGDELRVSRVLIAPGGKQMKVQKTAQGYIVRITDDPPVSRHKPSVDYLFQSVASVIGKSAVGVILTGMGSDGAKGLLEMRSKGAQTIGQDEASCVVYGMPKSAFEIGAVEKVASLDDIPKLILNRLEKRLSA